MSNPELETQRPTRVRWGLLIVLALIVIVVLGGILLVAGFASLVKGQAVVVKPDATLVLVLDRPIQETPPNPVMTELFHQKVYSLYNLESAIDRAAKDDRIKSLLIDVHSFPAGLGKIEEIREALQRFKKSKKPVWAYFESASTGGYLVAAEADKIYAPPTASLLLMGPAASVPFLRGVFDKFGIVPQLYHIGKYKSYSDTFMLKNMSDAQKEATNALLDSFYGQMVQAVAEGRRLSPDQVRDDMNVGFLWGDQIQKMGLVDGLWYRDQVEDALKKINGNSDRWNSIDIADYAKDHRVNLAAGAKKSLALVIASGDIVSGEGDGTRVQTESNLGSDTVIRWLRKVGRRSDISGVVLRVDSPGGSGLASDMMWRQIQVLRKSKPVVVSMSDLAASGGYYISMGADAIVAQPGTITGSIGVVTGKFVIKGLLDHIDYNQETLKRGANSDMFSGYTPFDKEQEALINQQMQAFYHDFVSKAAEGRKMTYDQVDNIGRGRVWSGEDALKLGLVDKLGGLHTAIQVAKEKAGIPKDEPVQIVVYPQPKTFFEAFFQGKMDAMVHADAVSKLPPELYEAYQNYEALRPLASEPFVLYTPVKVHL